MLSFSQYMRSTNLLFPLLVCGYCLKVPLINILVHCGSPEIKMCYRWRLQMVLSALRNKQGEIRRYGDWF